MTKRTAAMVSAALMLWASLLSPYHVATAATPSAGDAAGGYHEENMSSHSSIRGSSSDSDEAERRRLQMPGMPAFDPAGNRFQARRDFQNRQASTGCDKCQNSYSGQSVASDYRDDIFNQLSASEYNSLIEFCQKRGLADGTLDSVWNWNRAMNSNYIVFAQLFDPPKLSALEYLDGVTSTPPKRYGIVTIHRGAAATRDVMVCSGRGAASPLWPTTIVD